jgi:antirestriction protein ArdC
MMMTITRSRILDPNVRTEDTGTTVRWAERMKAYKIVPNSVTT